MKVAKFFILCLFMLAFFCGKAQESKCVSYVKFDYSITSSNNELIKDEIHFKSLDPKQKLVWHLIPISVNNLFEKNNLEEGILNNIPNGEYYMIVRDLSRNGNCPVSKLVVIKR